MKVLIPIEITDTKLISTNIAEDDHGKWDAGATYDTGDQVISTATHQVYRSLVDANTGNDPDTEWAAIDDRFDLSATEPTNWDRLYATNRYRAFDLSPSLQAENTGTIEYRFDPGVFVSGLAFFGLQANSVRVRFYDKSDTPQYDQTYTLQDNSAVNSWWTYFFSPIVQQQELVVLDIPDYLRGEIAVEISAGSAMAKVGEIVVGQVQDLGSLEASPEVLGRDKSTIEEDKFGTLVTVPREFVREVAYTFNFARNLSLGRENIIRKLKGGQPAVWIGLSDEQEATNVFGFVSDYKFTPRRDGTNLTKATLTAKGIS